MARLLSLTASIFGMMSPFCCLGHQTYQAAIPNGASVVRFGSAWPGVGHDSSAGGTPRNPFGLAFAGQGHSWTTALCQEDSDGDGQSNGFELGDPDCVWSSGDTPARTVAISHPGYSDTIVDVTTNQTVLTVTSTTSTSTSRTTVSTGSSPSSTSSSSSATSAPTTVARNTTSTSSESTVSTTSSMGSSRTSVTTDSSRSTSSSRSYPSAVSSTTSSTSDLEVDHNTTATSTTQQSSGVVEGTLSFVVTSGNASDLVEAYENDTAGAVASALEAAIAAGSDDVSEEDVTITGVELSPSERRVQAERLVSSRALTSGETVVVDYTIEFVGATPEEVTTALNSATGLAAIESSLTTTLQQIDPSLTIASVDITTMAVTTTTTTTTRSEPASFAAHAFGWETVVFVFSIASLLL